MTTSEWGRVGDDGTVYVKTADGERSVGQMPDATPEEALEFYTRRYDNIALEVELLHKRVLSGVLSPEEALASIKVVREVLVDVNAVGDHIATTLQDHADLRPQRRQGLAELGEGSLVEVVGRGVAEELAVLVFRPAGFAPDGFPIEVIRTTAVVEIVDAVAQGVGDGLDPEEGDLLALRRRVDLLLADLRLRHGALLRGTTGEHPPTPHRTAPLTGDGAVRGISPTLNLRIQWRLADRDDALEIGAF